VWDGVGRGFTIPTRRLDTSVWNIKVMRCLENTKLSSLEFHLDSTQRFTSYISVKSLHSRYEERLVHILLGNKNYLIDNTNADTCIKT
jgi:hypothetical protein